jgi:hypothetical protein
MRSPTFLLQFLADLKFGPIDLFRSFRADKPDDAADDEESAWRQEHQLQRIETTTLGSGPEDLNTQQTAVPEKLAYRTNQQKYEAVAETVADTVESAGEYTVTHGKALGTTENDAVRDNQTHEHG